jgi:DNA-binding beta-propeller fold protein YncE
MPCLLQRLTRAAVVLLATQGLPNAIVRASSDAELGTAERHLLYVVAPGIRDYLEFGGAGILVFDMDHDHAFLKRIETPASTKTKPENIKGVCAHAGSNRLFFSMHTTLYCLDLKTEKVVWEKALPGGCDRMSLTPDGKLLYVPSFEGAHWHVVNSASGEVTAKIEPKSGAHNTIVGLGGKWAYLAGLKSPVLTVVDVKTQEVVKSVGPFSAPIRPFTVNAAETLCFVNVNELLGFEVGDLKTGKKLYRVEVEGFKKGPVKRHGCPSHGIGLTPDEKEVWVCDAAHSRVHVFDATQSPPKQVSSVALREQPGWVTFSLDGRYAYPSTGEVVDTKTKKIVAALKDEKGREVHSEKMVEIVFKDGVPVRAGDQFGLGRAKQATGDNTNWGKPPRCLLTWGKKGTAQSEFRSPIGIAISAADEIFVTEFKNNRVQKFATDGKFLAAFSCAEVPGGIAVDKSGNVYVAPLMSHKVCVYSPAGKLLREWGKQGKGDGEFDQPGGIAVAPDGTVYVADQVNRRVQRFTPEGKFLLKWGEYGSKPGQFDGKEKLPNRTGGPNFVAVDRQGNVYTTEAALGRIQKFSSEGKVLLGFGDNSTGPGGFGGRPNNLPGPIAVCVDKQGRIWVSATNNRVQQFSAEGKFLRGFGKEGSEPGEFRTPHGLAIDSKGHLYVVDAQNQRIQKFAVDE